MKKQFRHTVLISKSKGAFVQSVPNFLQIKRYVKFLLDLVCDQPVEVSIHFCGIDEMIKANFAFRKKNRPTDVLSFVPDHTYTQNFNFLGDVLVCVPVCVQQAHEAKHSLSFELLKMIIHSLVHLKGFDHERSKAAANVMFTLEQTLMNEVNNKFGEPNFEK